MENRKLYPGSCHNHTDYSNFRLRDSINKVSILMDRALELGHKVLAITEHETVSSAIEAEEYYEKIKKNNPDFKLIRGNEIYLVRNGLNAENYDSKSDRFYHFILLAKDEIGHRQIREISTRAWSRSFETRRMTRVPTYYQDLYEVIGANPDHVIASSACIGSLLGVQLLRWRAENDDSIYEKIKIWCKGLQELFGKDNFYLEMQPSFNEEQIFVNQQIITLSNELDIPFIITNDAHYLKKEELPIQEAFLRSQDGDREVASFYATTYLMDDNEIHEYMDKFIGEENVLKAYSNIEKIMNSCENYTLKKPLKIPNLKWRQFNITEDEVKAYSKLIPQLNVFYNSDQKSDKYLVYAVIDGIKRHSDLQNERAYNEINSNLDMTWVSSKVNNANWSAYFLNLQKIVDTCWESGTLMGAGRGSGVGFILLYLLDITQINPLREKTKLYPWRFLNPDRVSVLD